MDILRFVFVFLLLLAGLGFFVIAPAYKDSFGLVILIIAAMLIACGYGDGVVKIIQAYQKKPPR